MCVIAIKPRTKRISYATIKSMFETNGDGAGFAIVYDDQTVVSKGYMVLETLWEDINSLQDEYLVIHFRWATHGPINMDMCHPFIVSQDEAISTNLYADTKAPVLIHNGVLFGFGDQFISDTCDFTINTLAKLDNVKEMVKLLKLTGSKFTLIHEGRVYRIGDFKKYKGLKVSNLDFDVTRFYKEYSPYEFNLPNGKISHCSTAWQDECIVLTGEPDSGEEGI